MSSGAGVSHGFKIVGSLWAIAQQYDLSAGTFSPDGRIFQVEYAKKAVENSGYVATDNHRQDHAIYEHFPVPRLESNARMGSL